MANRQPKTEVINLDTGELRIYLLPPRMAVFAAFIKDKTRWHDPQDFSEAEINLIVKTSNDGKIVYAGDYMAQTKRRFRETPVKKKEEKAREQE